MAAVSAPLSSAQTNHRERRSKVDDQLEFVVPASTPGQPTEGLPGTELKIRVMTERAGRREDLFHPLDGMGKRKRARHTFMIMLGNLQNETESA
jgi:hypothetical protein